LKEEYKTIMGATVKPQCNLVFTVDDSEVTVKNTDDWWNELAGVERFIGIPMKLVTDRMGGSYRTPHDHVLLYNMPENVLNALSGIKKYTDEFDKKKAIKELDGFSSYYITEWIQVLEPIINDIINKRLDSVGDIDPNTEILTLRCQGTNCKKILGKVNAQRQLITESSRSGSWIKTIMEKGFVKCKKCGNLLSWDSQKLNRR